MFVIRNTLSITFGALFVVSTLALGLLILSAQLPGGSQLVAEIRCLIGLPKGGSSCVHDAIADARTATELAERARERAEEALRGGSIVFEQGESLGDGVSVVVGTIYADAATRTGIARSFCYAIHDHEGLDPRVALAERDAGGTVLPLPVSAYDQALLRVDTGSIEEARRSCPWPDA